MRRATDICILSWYSHLPSFWPNVEKHQPTSSCWKFLEISFCVTWRILSLLSTFLNESQRLREYWLGTIRPTRPAHSPSSAHTDNVAWWAQLYTETLWSGLRAPAGSSLSKASIISVLWKGLGELLMVMCTLFMFHWSWKWELPLPTTAFSVRSVNLSSSLELGYFINILFKNIVETILRRFRHFNMPDVHVYKNT